MHLYVALLPPVAAREAVAEVVRRACDPALVSADEGSELSAGQGGRTRFGRARKPSVAPPASAGPPQLDFVPPEEMQLPVCSFGKVTTADAGRLEKAIRQAAADLAPPVVHLGGSAALEFPGDLSVWAQVRGDIDALRLISPGVTRTVESLGFFVDRRQFRPMLSVATITDGTGIEVLQRVVDALDAFQSEPWTVGTISLRHKLLGTPSGSREVAEIPLATG